MKRLAQLIGVRLFAAWLVAALVWHAPVDTEASTAPWPKPPQVTAKAAVLYDPTSREILAANDLAFVSLAPASTTKIVTCLVVLNTCELTEVVTVSQRAAATVGSRVGLRRGQQVTVEDLLFGLMLRSGNDAAVALAEHVAGTVEGFAVLMNHHAKLMGAWSTNFVNPHGLSAPGHLATAYDLAVIAAAALEHPVFRSLVSSQEYEIGSLDPAWTSLIRNTNQLLWSYEGADGVKTGTTREAGECLVASATRDGRQLISVVLGSRSRWADSARMLSYGFEGTTLVVAGRQGEVFANVGVPDPVSRLLLGRPIKWLVPVDLALASNLARAFVTGEEAEVNVRYELTPGLRLPLAVGEVAGMAIWESGGSQVAEVPLLVTEPAPQNLVYQRSLQALGELALQYLRQGLR